MEKKAGVQLELFNTQDQKDGSGRPYNAHFLSRIKSYEKVLLFIIALAVTNILSFSLGIERGKGIMSKKDSARFDVAVAKNAPEVTAPVATPVTAPVAAKVIPVSSRQGGFTIQLASYKTKVNAEKEALGLRKKGLSPIILSRGNYIVLCVGTFQTKETASTLLTDLKKRYAGCYVRRL